jgi:hypothetical protein
LVNVVSGMSEGRECVHYVALLGTIGPGKHNQYSDALRAGVFENRILRGRDFPHPSTPAVWPIELRTQWAPGLSQE